MRYPADSNGALRADRQLKIHARREQPCMVVRGSQRLGLIGRRHRELISRAEGELQHVGQREAANHHASGQEDLIEAAALAIRVVGPVHLDLGPECAQDVILKRDVGLDLIACGKSRRGEHSSDSALDVEIPETFAESKRGRVNPCVIAQAGNAGWRLDRDPGRQHIGVTAGGAARQPLFDAQERPVIEAGERRNRALVVEASPGHTSTNVLWWDRHLDFVGVAHD
jgi:hypothetical protein